MLFRREASTTDQDRPPLPWLSSLGALVLGSLVGLLLFEIGLRIYDPVELRVRGDRIFLPKNVDYNLNNPGVPGLDSVIEHSRNSLGFRGPEPPATVRGFQEALTVIAVGGSTTECAYLSDGDPWPNVLGDRLQASFDDLWVNNAGLDGHSTFGHLLLVRDYIAKLQPDVVLLLIGKNDVGREDLSKYDVDMLTDKTSNDATWKRDAILTLASYSAAFALAYNLYLGHRAHESGMGHGFRPWHEYRTSSYPDPSLSSVVQVHRQRHVPAYKRRVKMLVATLRSIDVLPVLITQPALYGGGIDPITGLDLSGMMVDGMTGHSRWTILDTYNDATRSVAENERVDLIDLAASMPKSTQYFYDTIHYNIEGATKVASVIAAELIAILCREFPHELTEEGRERCGAAPQVDH